MRLKNANEIESARKKLQRLEDQVERARRRPASPQNDVSIASLNKMVSQLREEIEECVGHDRHGIGGIPAAADVLAPPTASILEKAEVLRLAGLLRSVFQYITELRSQDVLAQRIQYPKIPPRLSESIVCHLIRDHSLLADLNVSNVSLGGSLADIVARTPEHESLRIEVKATGLSAFQEFGRKDILADVLIWLYFGRSFVVDDSLRVDAYVIRSPSAFFADRTKITLNTLRNLLGPRLESQQFDLARTWAN